MIPTRRTAALLAVAALGFLFLPPQLAMLPVVAVIVAAVTDALSARRRPVVRSERARILARGVASPLHLTVESVAASRARVRQPVPPDIAVSPAEGDGSLVGVLLAHRRGRHVIPAPSVRVDGPLRLGAWIHPSCGDESEVVVFPDVVMARKLAQAVRRGRFREQGRLVRGPLGLGTEFESIRDYLPDDDVRQVNWRATARLGRPMSNQFRVEQDRDVICVVDAGRLMAAPIKGRTPIVGSTPGPLGDERTRLDAAIDAATAVAMVVDTTGDRCGAIAFDAEVRRELSPRRGGGDAVVRALFDVEPNPVESDYELAFRRIGESKRALVFVFTDLLEESAARPLVEAIPVIARRHHVVVAGATDPDLDEITARIPAKTSEVYATAVALEVRRARAAAARHISAVGAEVIEAAPDALPAACVGAYLRAKARARV